MTAGTPSRIGSTSADPGLFTLMAGCRPILMVVTDVTDVTDVNDAAVSLTAPRPRLQLQLLLAIGMPMVVITWEGQVL